MNSKIQEHIQYVTDNISSVINSQIKLASNLAVASLLLEKIDENLSESVYMNGYGGMIWFDVYNREDLQKLMVIAPLWNKSTNTDVIEYKATVNGIEFKISAHDAALPDTCKLVEEEVIVPAVAEYTRKITRVQCNQPVEAAL